LAAVQAGAVARARYAVPLRSRLSRQQECERKCDRLQGDADPEGLFEGAGERWLARVSVQVMGKQVEEDGPEHGRPQGAGWINRALPAGELDSFVDRLARRIASYPPDAVAAAKQAVDAAELPLGEGLQAEAELLWPIFTGPAARQRFARVLAAGAQTRDGELDLEALIEAHA
jgi:hypothetical protein